MKRLRIQESMVNRRRVSDEEENNENLNLSLAIGPSQPPPPPQQPPPQQQNQQPFDLIVNRLEQNNRVPRPIRRPNLASRSSSRGRGARGNEREEAVRIKPVTVPALFPWSTEKRAIIRDLEYLRANELTRISGDVQCGRCGKRYSIAYDLNAKFFEIRDLILRRTDRAHDRAPPVWKDPVYPTCRFCQMQKSAKPIIQKKREINWLFLLLGQMLGICTLNQLKYFCKHNGIHRTGAKDRLLYLTYIGLCKHLAPSDKLFDLERAMTHRQVRSFS